MRTVKHFTQKEIEQILLWHVGANDHRDGGPKRKAEIIVELKREETGDPRDPPYSVVSCIRAEVTEGE